MRKSKELTQKVGPSLNEIDDSDDSDDDQMDIPEQVVDPNNPWLAERKEYTDFLSGYNDFVKNNSNVEDNNSQNVKNIEIEQEEVITKTTEESDISLLEDDKIIENINDNKKKKNCKNKVKNITVGDLSIFDDEESDVEILKIVNPPKKKVHFSNDTKNSETNINKNTNINSSTSHCKKVNYTEIVRTVSGPWFVTTDNTVKVDNGVDSKKKKIHKDVENLFKTVETELKNKINEKLVNLNKVEVKQSKKESVKHKKQEANSEYLKMHGKRNKTKFDEPLNENSKTLDNMNSTSVENYQGLHVKIVEKSKPAQNIDPTEFLKVAQTSLETEEMAQVEDHLDDKEENDQEKLIAEAFADDDIINEFRYS